MRRRRGGLLVGLLVVALRGWVGMFDTHVIVNCLRSRYYEIFTSGVWPCYCGSGMVIYSVLSRSGFSLGLHAAPSQCMET
jgi:hypothetical protein